MGKNLIQQRRGKGSIFASLGHQLKGRASHAPMDAEEGVVKSFLTNKIHTAPLMQVRYPQGDALMIAPEGVRIGDVLEHSGKVKSGNTLTLADIPEGTPIYNIEKNAGDGGKFARAGGNFARVSQKTEKGVMVILPSKKTKLFNAKCRATVGIVAGGGRKEKPFYKAGNKQKYMKAHHKQYPKVCGISMNAVAHPFGSKCSHVKGRPTQASRHAPPGRKVGKIAPSRTGMKR